MLWNQKNSSIWIGSLKIFFTFQHSVCVYYWTTAVSGFWSFWGHFFGLFRGLIFHGWLLKWPYSLGSNEIFLLLQYNGIIMLNIYNGIYKYHYLNNCYCLKRSFNFLKKLERESSILKNWWNEVYKVHYWAELNHISHRTYSSSSTIVCGKV